MSGTLLISVENRKKSRFYERALRALGVAGERVLSVTPRTAPSDVERRATEAAGVVMCGGPDVDPRRYGEVPNDEAGLAVYPALDELDWAVLAGARHGRVPVWAICRGMQVVNVFLGGSLHQDLELELGEVLEHSVSRPLDYLAHDLPEVRPGSLFASRLAGDGGIRVNSRHHQAVKELAPGLVPRAWAGDGVLEACEADGGGWWLRGVQWHPEDLVGLPEQRAMWCDFLDAADRHAGVEPAAARAARAVR